jgi:hypothetical protein
MAYRILRMARVCLAYKPYVRKRTKLLSMLKINFLPRRMFAYATVLQKRSGDLSFIFHISIEHDVLQLLRKLNFFAVRFLKAKI